MIGKSFAIAGALAGVLVLSAVAQAASPPAAPAMRHYNMPPWLYDHIIDQDNPQMGHGPGLRNDQDSHATVGGLSDSGVSGAGPGGRGIGSGGHGSAGGSRK